MNRISGNKPSGINASFLRVWGFLFVVLGVVGSSVIQNRFLKLDQLSNMQLLEAMQSSNEAMLFATIALVLLAVETCAVPVFCFLLVEGFIHTSDFQKYFLRVLGLAALSEIPYNFAVSGRLLDMTSRNPVFAMVLCLALLYFYNRYSEKSVKNLAIRAAVTVAAVVWCSMLSIQHGAPSVVMVAVLWLCRYKPTYRNFAGCMAAASCCIFSPFYLAAPMGFLAVHFYNGEKGGANRNVVYLTYPVILLAIGFAAKFVM